jgi:hypothetical protein
MEPDGHVAMTIFNEQHSVARVAEDACSGLWGWDVLWRPEVVGINLVGTLN